MVSMKHFVFQHFIDEQSFLILLKTKNEFCQTLISFFEWKYNVERLFHSFWTAIQLYNLVIILLVTLINHRLSFKKSVLFKKLEREVVSGGSCLSHYSNPHFVLINSNCQTMKLISLLHKRSKVHLFEHKLTLINRLLMLYSCSVK